MRGNTAIKVLLADDHQLVRAGLRTLLDRLPDVEVQAEASDGEELLRALDSVQVDVVVTDLQMPRVDGLTALRRIREHHPALKVIVLSMDDSTASVRDALASGAHAFLRKDAPASELETALRSVMVSGSYIGTDVMQRLALPQESANDVLTERQLQILVRLAEGKSTKEIAFDLGLSTKTVDVHRRRIMEVLQLGDIASLTRYAVRHGLVAP